MRRRFFTIILPCLVLLLSVPWWFEQFSTAHIWGFPLWAAYSLAVSVCYAIIVTIMIGKCWPQADQ